MTKDIKDFVKYLTEVSDNHGIKQEERLVTEICDCPKCDGKIVEKKSKRGKVFYGCNNYPKCKEAYWDKPVGKKCPECGCMLTEKKNTIKCSSCDYKSDTD